MLTEMVIDDINMLRVIIVVVGVESLDFDVLSLVDFDYSVDDHGL